MEQAATPFHSAAISFSVAGSMYDIIFASRIICFTCLVDFASFWLSAIGYLTRSNVEKVDGEMAANIKVDKTIVKTAFEPLIF